ncbi:transposase [Sorangium sp. So ce117]
MRIAADDGGRRPARERLVRYCSRPAFALDRIELLPDGRIAYLLKTPRRGRTLRVMNPMEFMARLAALIPPPKIPLVRYHGVFAPRSSWRCAARDANGGCACFPRSPTQRWCAASSIL